MDGTLRNKRRRGLLLACALLALAAALLAGALFPGGRQEAFADDGAYENGCTVEEIDDLEAIVDTGNVFSLTAANMSVEWAEGVDGSIYILDKAGKTDEELYSADAYTLASSNGGFTLDDDEVAVLCVERKSESGGWTVNGGGEVCTVTFSSAGSIGGRAVDVVVTISDIQYGSISWNREMLDFISFFSATNSRASVDGSTYNSGYFGAWSCETSFEIVWSDTKKTVDLPFFMCVSDIDIYNSNLSYAEAWESVSGFTGTYYVYKGNVLDISMADSSAESGSGMKFSASAGMEGRSDDESYTDCGVYAPTESGTFTCRFYATSSGSDIQIYSVYSVFDTVVSPTKTASVNGDSGDDTAAESDTVTWDLDFAMPTFYVDTVTTFSSLVWTDALPDETNYVSAKLCKSTDGGLTWSDVSSSSGTLSQSSGAVTYAFNESFLSDEENYDGALYRLSITTTANASINDVDTVVNEATLTVDGIGYDVSATIWPESGSLTIGKTVENGTSVSASKTFAFTVTLADRSGEALSGSYAVIWSDGTSGTVTNGGTISLQDGQTATISGLPAGTTWTVTEAASSGYAASSSTLSGTIATGATSTASFKNIYSAAGSWTPAASKTLATSAGVSVSLAEGQFTFQVTDAEGEVVSTGTNAADGTVSFSAVAFDENDAGKSFTYTLSEVTGDDETISYDSQAYTATVTVADNGDGTLSASVVYSDTEENALEGAPTFENILKDGSLTISKTALGTTLDDGEHYDLKSFDVVVTLDGESQTLTLDSSNSWTVTIEDIPALTAYTVEEIDIPAGYTIESISPSSGMIEAAADTSVVVSNSYVATGSWTPESTKALEGGDDGDLEYYSFDFVLTDEEGNVLLEGESDSEGVVSFEGSISYSTENGDLGEHIYTMYEVDGEDRDIDYDDAVQTVTVTVTDDGDGTLTATAVYDDEAVSSFLNAYAFFPVSLPSTGKVGAVVAVATGVALVIAGIAVWTAKTRRGGKTGKVAGRR